ncbi:integral membrane protein [Apiospora sp. TS-2023a]
MTPSAPSSVQPAYPPPDGLVSNFIDPEDHSGIVYRVGYGFTFAAFVVLMIRLYTRLFVLKRGLLPDDYLVIVAMALSVGFIITTFKAAEYGMGRHLYDVPFDEYSPHFLTYMTASTVIWALSVTTAKMSILLLYLQLSPVPKVRWAVYFTLFVVVSYSLIATFTTIFGCVPIEATWDHTPAVLVGAACLERKNAIYATSSLNIITDFTILLLPIPMFWNLQMPRRQKAAIISLFLAGGVVCIVAIVRTVSMPKLWNSFDYTWLVVDQYVMCFIEIDLGIICACVCTIRPFFRKHLPYLMGSSPSKNKESGPHGGGVVGRRISPGVKKEDSLGSGDSYQLRKTGSTRSNRVDGTTDGSSTDNLFPEDLSLPIQTPPYATAESDGHREHDVEAGLRSGIRKTTDVTISRSN